ncbi:MAG: MMPL family transporter [Dehalococcoidia bacterium]|nr:MMPL family transporter [Dehalococcoidia bacterium]
MASFVSTGGLARASARRPWLVVGVWIALLAASVGIVGWGLSGVLTNEQKLTNNPESQHAVDVLATSGIPGREQLQLTEVFIVRSADLTVDSPRFKQFADTLLADVRALDDHVATATSYFETSAPTLVSADKHTMLLPVTLRDGPGQAEEHFKPLHALVEARQGDPDFEVLTFGLASLNDQFKTTAEADLRTGESIGISVALVILVLVFGAVVAAIVPLVLAIMSIIVALAAATLVGQLWPLQFFVTNIVFMIGLAVGIDYALFIVERFREERRHGLEKLEAIALAGNTASRAVLFSGITVVIALAGMLIVPNNIFRAIAGGAILVVIATMFTSLTLLPAVLSLLGDRVNKLSIPFFSKRGQVDESRGFWAGTVRVVMAHPWVSVIGATALLVALSVPYFSINLGLAGADQLPEKTEGHRANEILAREFSQGLAQPTDIVVTASDVTAAPVQTAVGKLNVALQADPRFATSNGQSVEATLVAGPRREVGVLSVAIQGDPASDASLAAVRDLRSAIIPQAFAGSGAEVLVGGLSAGNVDFFDQVNRYTPIVFAFVLTLSFILLMMVFRSIVVPLKAILMNLLSVSAAYGLLVLVFQKGFLIDVFGFQRSPVIEAWLPLFLFTILFGLSMDYHVFLLSRIRERFDQTRDNAGSVAFGLRSTANIITGAALIMVAVFGGFALGDMVMFQEVGFGLGVAVLLDATIVRTVLVPAAMELLGDRNWYLPQWLHWLPDLRVEGGPATARQPLPAAGDD